LDEKQRIDYMEKIPVKRIGEVSDVAAAVAFLCSGAAV
jgi:NAD(P)-dependent dehydrogenase (short-subunit alcohol dehydrogenase family)